MFERQTLFVIEVVVEVGKRKRKAERERFSERGRSILRRVT